MRRGCNYWMSMAPKTDQKPPPSGMPDPQGPQDPMVPKFVPVRDRREEAPGIFTLDMEPPEGDGSFQPGQFNMLYAMGAGESAISLSGDPGPGLVRHTIRAVGATTRALVALR